MSIMRVNREKFEQDRQIKALAVSELQKVDEEMTMFLWQILDASGQTATKVNLPLYRKIKNFRDRLRSVL